jgi:hypothetical protein
MDIQEPALIFGFEAQPNEFAEHMLIARFYSKLGLEGTLVGNVDGLAGARLFAARSSVGFTSVTLTSDADFGIAQVRYAVPEPASIVFLTAFLAAVGVLRRTGALS